MSNEDIIVKLKKAGLWGRSGSGFPTGLKWEIVKKARAQKKYIICNAASGEPKVLKDGFILENYPREVVAGIKIALKTIDHSSAFIYLRKDFYQKFKKRLEKLIRGQPISLFKKKGGYLAGEETCLCEVIEGKIPEPRIRPPFPTQAGLWGKPTLINNVETFYYVAQIAKDNYKNTRFYTITGRAKNPGVYELPLDWSIERILKETKNYPFFDFFLQAGGGAGGEILLPPELRERKVPGPGAIIIFDRKRTSLWGLMREWADFFLEENCDKCTPCREGIFRLAEMIAEKKIDRKLVQDINFVLRETSFCGLGKIAGTPFLSLIDKLPHDYQ